MRRKRGRMAAPVRALLVPVAAVLVLVGFSTGLDNLAGGRAQEDMEQLETAVRRSCVACFAAEGSYPQDLEYLKDHYGLQIDESRYVVYYEVFASNLMPDITVLELEK